MSSQIINISDCRKELVAEVPAEEVASEYEQLARKLARTAKVPGFRPGKVPLSVIKQRFGSDLRHDAVQEIIQRHWKAALEEQPIKPLDKPAVKDLQDEPGAPLKFTLTFEVAPQLEIKDYKDIAASIETPQVADADVEKALESLREQHAQFIPVEGSGAKDGQVLTATLDGEFQGGGKPIHEDDVSIEIGGPETHEAFSEALRGAQPGAAREFEVTYPAEHHRKRFAGKTIRFKAAVKEIKEKQLPELGDDFAKDLGSESLEKLREKVREELLRQARESAEKKSRETVLDEAVKRNLFEVPEAMVEDELRVTAGRIATSLEKQGLDPRRVSLDWQKLLQERRPEAEQAVRRSLVLDAVARQESIEVTDEDLDAEFARMAGAAGKSPAALRAQFEKDQRIQSFRELLKRQKALDFIIRSAKISRG